MSSTEENPSAGAEPERPSVPGYQIESFAGRSPGIERWDAVQASLDRRVVLLTLKSSLVGDAARVAHFEEVARVVARLGHRNFVQVIDIARTDAGLPYVVTETIDGRTLADAVREDGPFAPDAAAKIVLQLADALDAAWKQAGFVHRNVKPDNVYLLPDGSAKIGSFLFATIARSVANPLAADDGLLAGTPNYMPPEQADRVRTIDFRADIYSTGALFYQALTGQVPFGAETDPARVVELQKEGVLPAPSDLVSAVPVPFSRIVQKMMAKRPSDRYGFWQDVVEDIQRALAGRDLFVAGGGPWVSPRSTVADPSPAAAPGKPRIRVSAAARAASPAAAAAPASRIRIGAAARKAGAPAAAPQAPLRAAPPIRAVPAAPAAPAAGVSLPRIAVTPLAPVAPSDGGTRRSAPVAPSVSAPAAAPVEEPAEEPAEEPVEAPVAAPETVREEKPAVVVPPVARPARAAVPPAARPAPVSPPPAAPQPSDPGDRPAAPGKAPLVVRIAGFLLFVFVLFFAMWKRVGDLESGGGGRAGVSPAAPAVIRSVAPQAARVVDDVRLDAGSPEPRKSAAKAAKGKAAKAAAEEAPETDAASAGLPGKRLPMDLFEDAVYQIVLDLRSKPWPDAAKSAVRAMHDVAAKAPEKAADCSRVETAIKTAASWEDLVGSTLFASGEKRELTLGRTTHVIVPTGLMPGVLVCDRIVNGQTLQNQRLPLDKVSSKDKWAIVSAAKLDEDDVAMLRSRALLTLAFGTEEQFRTLLEGRAALEPLKAFLLVYELERD